MYDPAAMAKAPSDSHALLTIVRHGQTSANIEGVWHGSTNTPLTEHGRLQAAAVGRHIEANHPPVDHVYASPLDRAHHTAQAIADPLGLTPRLDPALVEYDLGSWEGLSFRHLFEEKKLFQNMAADPDFAPHGGETPLIPGQQGVQAWDLPGIGRVAIIICFDVRAYTDGRHHSHSHSHAAVVR